MENLKAVAGNREPCGNWKAILTPHVMALLIVLYGVVYIWKGEIAPVNFGMGWDGVRYAWVTMEFEGTALAHDPNWDAIPAYWKSEGVALFRDPSLNKGSVYWRVGNNLTPRRAREPNLQTIPVYLDESQKEPAGFVEVGQQDSYVIQRVVPCALVHYSLRALGLPTNQISTLVRGFQWYNLGLLVLSVYGWHGIARRMNLGLRGEWLGFAALLGNFAILKFAFWDPVLVDTTAFLIGIVMLYCYLSGRQWCLLTMAIVGTYAWPLTPYCAAPLLLFPRNSARPAAAFQRLPMVLYIVPGILILLATCYFLASPTFKDYFIDRSEPIWMRAVPLSGIIVVAFVFFALRPLVDRAILARGLFFFRELTVTSVIMTLALFVSVKLIMMHVLVPRAEALQSARWMFEMVCLSSVQKPGVFFLAHFAYFGPVMILGIFFWPRICQLLRDLGLGLIVVVGFGLFWYIRPESRQSLTFLPILVVLCCKAIEEVPHAGWRDAVFAGVTLLVSRFWLPLNSWGPLLMNDDYSTFPWQLLFMNSGPWMSGASYYLLMLAAFVVASVLWLLYPPRWSWTPATAAATMPTEPRSDAIREQSDCRRQGSNGH